MAETSGINHDLAAAVGHAFRVERHPFRLHRPGQSRIFHCLVVHLIAMGARLVHDPRENHGFACFGFTTPGNDFTLIVFKSSPTHSRNLSAPYFRQILEHSVAIRRYAGRFFFGTGKTYPSTYFIRISSRAIDLRSRPFARLLAPPAL